MFCRIRVVRVPRTWRSCSLRGSRRGNLQKRTSLSEKVSMQCIMRLVVEWHKKMVWPVCLVPLCSMVVLVMGYLSWGVNWDLGSCFLLLTNIFVIVFLNEIKTGVVFMSIQIPCTLTLAVGKSDEHLPRACQRTYSWKFSSISWDLSPCPCLSGTAALEEDAQILKVIEAYCTSAKTRQTLNSSEYASAYPRTC